MSRAIILPIAFVLAFIVMGVVSFKQEKLGQSRLCFAISVVGLVFLAYRTSLMT